MKKTLSIALSALLIFSLCSCSDKNTVESVETIPEQEIKLVNHMTEAELAGVNKHSLTLLDEPVVTDPLEAFNNSEHTLQIEYRKYTKADLMAGLEAMRDTMSEEDYQQSLDYYNSVEDDYSETFPGYFLLDGQVLFDMMVFSKPYDGGSIDFSSYYNDGTVEEHHCENLDEYLDYVKKQCISDGRSKQDAELTAAKVKLAVELFSNGDYETLPEGTVDRKDESKNLYNVFHNYRSDWEFDREEVEEIKDSVDEISIFDEELSKDFIVHVTLPPDYDKDKTYPVFFLTDGIWRFGNCPELRKCMENGEAAPVILVSLYYSYDVTDPDQEMRYEDLVINRELLLNFITDNLMPYLCENYNIDCGNSTLYGHSDGGVFTHHALFNSDKYENQPFGHYIIGSPALWGLKHYNEYEGISNDIYMNDYGYLERYSGQDRIPLCRFARGSRLCRELP